MNLLLPLASSSGCSGEIRQDCQWLLPRTVLCLCVLLTVYVRVCLPGVWNQGLRHISYNKYFTTELQSKFWTPQFYLLDVTQMFTLFLHPSTFLPRSQKAAMSAPFIKVLLTLSYITLPSGKIQPQRRLYTTFQLKSMGWIGSGEQTVSLGLVATGSLWRQHPMAKRAANDQGWPAPITTSHILKFESQFSWVTKQSILTLMYK